MTITSSTEIQWIGVDRKEFHKYIKIYRDNKKNIIHTLHGCLIIHKPLLYSATDCTHNGSKWIDEYFKCF